MATADTAAAYVARPERWDCDMGVMIRDDCDRAIAGRLANISEGGFMAECEEKIRKGAVVDVDIPGRGPVRAEVRWVLGWRFGAMILG
ncbi:MAG TPA: PilZ domain-containing protein [Rhizomicrobium sp.]|nr:PilZ domain-containing protein [Rhizomicrobium sp.]